VFDSETNGIQGNTVLTVQLYERSGRHAGTLLESMTFDAANPGRRSGGSLFKALTTPLTLLPGNYTIAAYGFDETKPEGNAGRPPYDQALPPWKVNDGAGLVHFEGSSRYENNGAGRYPGHLDKGPANRYAAGTFIFSETTLPSPPYAADYKALTAGVRSFPVEDARHMGSISVLDDTSFPVLVEMGGNRLVMEAAGTCCTNGARAVAFANTQWGRSLNDARGTLFENAVKWAARKSEPSRILLGITTNMDVGYFRSRGYQVLPLTSDLMSPTNPPPPVDVLVADWEPGQPNLPVESVKQFTVQGGGLVMTMTPWHSVHLHVRGSFGSANNILEPFGLAYRASLSTPADWGFTNIQEIPYPTYFSAFPAAELLYKDRVGQLRLNGQEKAIALNTVAYASLGRLDVLASLRAVYSGTANSDGGSQPTVGADQFIDALVLTGSDATANHLGRWEADGSDLVAHESRGSLEYEFNLATSDMYRLQIEATASLANGAPNHSDLVLSVDGERLGRYPVTNGPVQCLLPYLLAGQHRLRILWDNAAGGASLRVRTLHFQIGVGPTSDGGDVKDWVEQAVRAQCGLDQTNDIISSYVSPVCVEGRDAHPSLMTMDIEGADNKTPRLRANPGPNGRWYEDVPLSAYANAETILHVTYQNGALTETRHLHWLPLNLLAGSDVTIRQGDSLLFTAQPAGSPTGRFVLTVGTNQLPPGRTSQPRAYLFAQAGSYQVSGTYTSPNGTTQSVSIVVKVVDRSLAANPTCWVGRERDWDLPTIAPEAVLDADNRLLLEQTANLPDQGERMGVLTDKNEPRYILSRLGTNGPVLASAKADGFNVSGAPDTYNRVLTAYPDGSRLVEALVILSPVPTASDFKVQLRVIVGGVTFDDGTTYRELRAADFDALGRYPLRFIMPASVRTANCHNITAVQGATLVGSY
jgi:hypothetical protein